MENKHNVDGLLEEEEKNTEKNYVSLDFGMREKERGRKKKQNEINQNLSTCKKLPLQIHVLKF